MNFNRVIPPNDEAPPTGHSHYPRRVSRALVTLLVTSASWVILVQWHSYRSIVTTTMETFRDDAIAPLIKTRATPSSAPNRTTGTRRTALEERLAWIRSANGPDFDSSSFISSYWMSTIPWTNVTTLGYWRQQFYSGYRNQIMGLIALCMWAKHDGHGQILLETLNFKDTYGSEQFLPFEYLFDVPHWNSYYPQVPRLVHCHFYNGTTTISSSSSSTLFPSYHCQHGLWKCNGQMDNCHDPHARGKEVTELFTNYMRYAKGKGPLASNSTVSINGSDGGAIKTKNPVDIAILQGALRPHPRIREFTQRIWKSKKKVASTGRRPYKDDSSYLTLHARIEPDMQHHPMCAHLKVVNLTQLIDMVERAFPIPPARYVFMPINRPTLEADAVIRKRKATNWLAIENLHTLNCITTQGMWNGTIPVIELGSNILQVYPPYNATPSIVGAMLNFEMALESTIFIGTPVSSWSVDVVASRFWRWQQQQQHSRNTSSSPPSSLIHNYQYLPSGVVPWTHTNDSIPPHFYC